MEKSSPFMPGETPAETEPITPETTDEPLETTAEIAVDEEYLTVDAIDRHSQEAIEHKLAEEEPFELIHGRRTEVMDEPTSSPVVAIGSVINDALKRQPALTPKSATHNNKQVSELESSLVGKITPLAKLTQLSKPYKQPILAGFAGAWVIIIVYILSQISF